MTPRTFELFVASRYLRAKRKQAVISVITVISIAGVAAGVMALVIGIAINNGFRDTLQRSLLGATAHVMVLRKSPGGNRQLAGTRSQASPASARGERRAQSLWVRCCWPDRSAAARPEAPRSRAFPVDNPPDMLKHLKQGSFERLKDTSGFPASFSVRAWRKTPACCWTAS